MTLWESIFHTTAYTSRETARRAQILYGVLVVLFGAVTIAGLRLVILPSDISAGIALGTMVALLAAISLGVITIQRGYVELTSQVTLISLIIGWGFIALNAGDVLSIRVAIWPALIIMLAGLLLNFADLRTVMLGMIIAFMGVSVVQSIVTGEVALNMLVLAAYGGVVALTLLFRDMTQMSRRIGQAQASDGRDKLMAINRELIEQASQRTTIDDAMNMVVGMIVERFDEIYHAQVFLLAPDKVQAELKASTGSAGEQLLERNHSLAVGSLSIIGQATLRNEAVIARVDDPNSVHRPNNLLPDTKLEVAFPLRVGQEVIGALDIQSRREWDFTPQDRQLFQTLADSLSLVIDNIQQFDRARTSIEENRRLAEQANRAMFDVERLNQRLIGRAWSEYLTGKDQQMGFVADLLAGTEENNADWTAGLAQASTQNLIVQEGHVLSVPLRVRGQVIGAMEFELDDDQLLTPEDLDMVQEISERFGLAAENTRLVEESQRVAQREALINEISSRLQASNNVEATLAETARSLSDTLQATRVVIKLGEPDDPIRSNGSQS